MIKERESLINLLNAFLYLGLYSKHDYALIFFLSELNVSCIKSLLLSLSTRSDESIISCKFERSVVPNTQLEISEFPKIYENAA